MGVEVKGGFVCDYAVVSCFLILTLSPFSSYHFEMSWLKEDASSNISLMLVTLEVSLWIVGDDRG